MNSPHELDVRIRTILAKHGRLNADPNTFAPAPITVPVVSMVPIPVFE